MIDDAGIAHQRNIMLRKKSGGIEEAGKRSTREKLECTSAQVVHGRRPGATLLYKLYAVNTVAQTISVTAMAMSRR
jgi:hypothetical protein